MDENATTKDKLALLVGVAKTEALRVAIAQLIKQKNNNESESVEIYLYFEQTLREQLGLVTAIKNMRYTCIGKRNWENDLVKSVNENYIKKLLSYPNFETLALKDEDLQKKKDEIMRTSQDEMAKIMENSENSENDLKQQADQLLKETNEKIDDLYKNWVNLQMN